jgi:hypothetical protein
MQVTIFNFKLLITNYQTLIRNYQLVFLASIKLQ